MSPRPARQAANATERCVDSHRPSMAAARPRSSPSRRSPQQSPPAPSQSRRGGARTSRRSEEHTSELQSLMRISYAVFCLKKKKQKHKQISDTTNNRVNQPQQKRHTINQHTQGYT